MGISSTEAAAHNMERSRQVKVYICIYIIAKRPYTCGKPVLMGRDILLVHGSFHYVFETAGCRPHVAVCYWNLAAGRVRVLVSGP